MPNIDDIVATVETWQVKRHEEAQAFTQRGLRGFVETMNFHTRKLISLLDKKDPEFYSALLELAQHACTMTTPGAKTFADKKDVTNL